MAGNSAANSEVVIKDRDDEGFDDLNIVLEDDDGGDGVPGLFDDEGGFGTKEEAVDEGFSTSEERTRLENQIADKDRATRELEQQLAAERADREKAEADKAKIGQAFAKTYKSNIESEIKSVESSLIKAKEEADSSAEVKLEGQLSKLRNDLNSAESTINAFDNQPEPEPKVESKPSPQPSSEQNQEAMREAQNWVKNNKWYSAPVNKQEEYKKNMASRINDKILEEGKLDPTSADYYKELDRRMAMEDQKSKRSPVSGVSNSASGPTGNKPGKQTVRITADEKAMLRELKLNPDDPSVQKQFAQQKLAVDGRWQQDEPINPETL